MNLIVERGKPYEYRDLDTGEKFFSVTQVRNIMWDGLSRVPFAVLEAARERGQRLHQYFALALGAQVDACAYPDRLRGLEGYCQAIDSWIEEWKPIPHTVEEPSCNRKLGIAGTRDADVTLADALGTIDIVDLKSGEPTPTDPVQLLAYHTMEGCTTRKRLFDLYIREDGTKEFKQIKPILHQSDWATFQNAIQVLKWRAGR